MGILLVLLQKHMDKHMDKQHIVDGKVQTKILRCDLLFIADAELFQGTYNLCA